MIYNEVFMASPINAIIEGLYQTPMTLAELKENGNFGIGTFNDLNGELVLLDGVAYQLDVNGHATLVSDKEKTPFAAVCFFKPFSVEEIVGTLDNAAFNQLLNCCLPSPNLLYAIKVIADFERVRTRSVPKTENYTPLVEATAKQKESVWDDVSGTLVGFYTPDFIPSVNVPGYHFHFMTKDLKRGGHLLDCQIRGGQLAIQICTRLKLNMPLTLDYLNADFKRDARSDLEKAER